MPLYSFREAAAVLGVSADTVRRWADGGRLPTTAGPQGHRAVEGPALAAFATEQAAADSEGGVSSMRNRFPGIVTRVMRGDVAAQVEVQSGPHRLVALLTREAVDEMNLAPGDRATAVVKATNVAVEISP